MSKKWSTQAHVWNRAQLRACFLPTKSFSARFCIFFGAKQGHEGKEMEPRREALLLAVRWARPGCGPADWSCVLPGSLPGWALGGHCASCWGSMALWSPASLCCKALWGQPGLCLTKSPLPGIGTGAARLLEQRLNPLGFVDWKALLCSALLPSPTPLRKTTEISQREFYIFFCLDLRYSGIRAIFKSGKPKFFSDGCKTSFVVLILALKQYKVNNKVAAK